MGLPEDRDVRDKALGEGVAEAIRDAFAQLFNMVPLPTTTTT